MNRSLEELTTRLRHLEAEPRIAGGIAASPGSKTGRHRAELGHPAGMIMPGRLEVGHAFGMASGTCFRPEIARIPDNRLVQLFIGNDKRCFRKLRA